MGAEQKGGVGKDREGWGKESLPAGGSPTQESYLLLFKSVPSPLFLSALYAFYFIFFSLPHVPLLSKLF